MKLEIWEIISWYALINQNNIIEITSLGVKYEKNLNALRWIELILRKNILIAGLICLVLIVAGAALAFLYLSDAFRPEPSVTIRPDNTYSQTLYAVTDSDYEPFSYIGSNGQYMGMDVELIAEIANRLHMNLNLTLTDWKSANKLFLSGNADVFLNMETDSVAADPRMVSTLPTVEKQYVVYGRETISSVPELYGRKVASLHKLPELGLGSSITYIDSYAEIFEALKAGEYDFAICPIQIGNVFLEKLRLTDVKPSYAVGHIYGAIALPTGHDDLRRQLNTVIAQLQKEGRIAELERKWITHRYQSMTVMGMIEAHPEVMAAIVAAVVFMMFLSVCIMLLNKNIKDRDAYSKALLIEKERAEASSRAKSVFLSNMSHEIRTPINAVLGMNEMIIRESRDNKITGYARNVDSAGRNLLSIINDILDISKIDSGQVEVINAPYRLSSLLNDASNMVIFKAQEKGLTFSLKVEENLPDKLEGDEVRIRQVLTNVLSNAVKFTSEGSVKFSVSGEKTSDDTVQLVFVVSDTGAGIRQEDIGKLFAKFERVNLTRDRTIEGTGLGLAISRNLLDMMGGEITAESDYGKGSTFTVSVPQKVLSWEGIGRLHEKFESVMQDEGVLKEHLTAPEARILVVDDTAMNLTVIEGLLAKTKIQIDTVLSGNEALRMTMSIRYDIIFMDQMMPEMDGTEALHHIREQTDGLNATSPVICLTADAVSGARERYLSEGFTDYLPKPVGWTELESMLAKYLPAQKIVMVTEDDDVPEDGGTELQELYGTIDGLSYSDAVKYCSNEEILGNTLKTFYQSIDSNANAIEKFLSEKDYKNYTIKVHALKSSARLIGAGELSADAKYLEDCGNDLSEESITAIEERTPKLLEDYRSLKEKLSPLYAENENLPEIAPEDLQEVYEAIKEFAYSFDIDSIDGVIEQARQYKIPDEEKARFEAVETAARNMDWEALNEALK